MIGTRAWISELMYRLGGARHRRVILPQRRPNDYRPVVEELEIRSLMTTSGGLTLTGIGPVLIDIGPLTGPPLMGGVDNSGAVGTNPGVANSYGGPANIVSWTQGSHGTVVYSNHDGLFNYTPNPGILGLDTFTVTATDGIDTASLTDSVIVVYTQRDYQADVNYADQAYNTTVQNAVDVRQGAIDTARATATDAAATAYGTYQSSVATAIATYVTDVTAAVTAYQTAVTTADATAATAYGEAGNAYTSALTTAQGAYDTAVASDTQVQQTALDSADGTYSSSVAPYQATRDNAYAYYQANPYDSDAQQAFNDADAALNAAIQDASAIHDAAYANADTVYQAALDSDSQTLATANASALTTLQASEAAADAAWVSSEATAWTTFTAAKTTADAVVIQAESDAWSTYLTSLGTADATRASSEAGIQSTFNSTVAGALSTWQGREQTAWNMYSASIPNLPPDAQQLVRYTAPGPVADIAPFAGLTTQPREDMGFVSIPVPPAAAPTLQQLQNSLALARLTVTRLETELSNADNQIAANVALMLGDIAELRTMPSVVASMNLGIHIENLNTASTNRAGILVDLDNARENVSTLLARLRRFGL